MDAPYDAIYDVMKPPATTEERLSWDKSIFHYEMLKSISPVIYHFCIILLNGDISLNLPTF